DSCDPRRADCAPAILQAPGVLEDRAAWGRDPPAVPAPGVARAARPIAARSTPMGCGVPPHRVSGCDLDGHVGQTIPHGHLAPLVGCCPRARVLPVAASSRRATDR